MTAREEALAYLQKYSIKEAIDDVVNSVMKDRPDDPFVVLAESVAAKSVGAKGILDVVAREVLDSKGKPTVEVEVRTEQDTFRASCACGQVQLSTHLRSLRCRRNALRPGTQATRALG